MRKSKKIIVFAGTTEGRNITEFLRKHKINTAVFVATDYGRELLLEDTYIKVHRGRMKEEEMAEMIKREKPEAVIDATHPFAETVTENIRRTCVKTEVEYLRLLRRGADLDKESVIYVESIEEAINYLNCHNGNVLVTTGSKDARAFTAVNGFKERIYLRILPFSENLKACTDMGFQPSNIICMQGPFSAGCNEAMLEFANAVYLVTKESGKAGGLDEKLEACKAKGVTPIVIGKPFEKGLTEDQIKKVLFEKLDIKPVKQVAVIGGGVGNRDFLTRKGEQAINHAELIITTRRLYEGLALQGKPWADEYRPAEIKRIIENSPESRIAVIFSGDTGFYSAAKTLGKIGGAEIQFISGISSMVYFMNVLGKDYESLYTVSVHGRKSNFVGQVQRNAQTLILLGGKQDSAYVSKTLTVCGFGGFNAWVGSNLGHETEEILVGKVADFVDNTPKKLELMLIENPNPAETGYALQDKIFKRGKVPMTKEEVRTITLSKLRLREDSVLWDIGAGTGSVSCGAALIAVNGRVFAVEKNEEARALIQENKETLGGENIEIILGQAPEVLAQLPPPTHAFIGGTGGKMAEIISLIFEKNPNTRVVMNIISLDSLAEVMKILKCAGYEDAEIIQVTLSRSRTIAGHHLMEGQNPVYIISFSKRGGTGNESNSVCRTQ